VIYYTLDGSLPTTNSLKYTGPIVLTNGAITVSANAFASGHTNSVAASALFVVQPLYFASEGFTNQNFSVQFVGAAGSNYVLEATTNFTTWVPLSTNTAPSGAFILSDPNAKSFPMRFYRVIQQ
jgi:Fn3 associated